MKGCDWESVRTKIFRWFLWRSVSLGQKKGRREESKPQLCDGTTGNWKRGFTGNNRWLIFSSLVTEHTRTEEHTQESGTYLPHFLTIKVRGELFLSLGDACLNGNTNTTTTLPNVGIFTALGAGELVGLESRHLPRPSRFVGGQSQWGQLSSPLGVGGGWRFVDTLGGVSNRSNPDSLTSTSSHGEDPVQEHHGREAHLSHWLLLRRVPPHTHFTPGICSFALPPSPPSPPPIASFLLD